MIGKRFARTALAVSLGLALGACSSHDGVTVAQETAGASAGAGAVVADLKTVENAHFSATGMLSNVSDHVITATYVDMNERIGALRDAVEALNTGTATQAKLKAAQDAWRAARVPWERSEAFLFGPVDVLGIDPAIDSWPLNTADLVAFLNSNPKLTLAQVENASDDLRGFHAIEYLLFGNGVKSNTRSAKTLTAAERAYLVALSQVLKNRSQALVDAWTRDFNGRGGYAAQLKNPGAGSAYATQAAALDELIDGLVAIAEELMDAKLGEPMGSSIASADASKVESQYSWNSLSDFHDNLQSILNVYTGVKDFKAGGASVAGDYGLYAFVRAHDQALADRVQAEIIQAQQSIALIKGDGNASSTVIGKGAKPFRTQIKNEQGRALIQTAIDSVQKLRDSLKQDVKPLVARTRFGA